MEKERLEKLKALILQRQREILKQLGARTEDIDQIQGEVTPDWIDRVSVDSAVNNLMFMESGLAQEMEAIREALIKMQKGTYGICERCGEEITYERLEALPLARLCLKCQSEEEKHQRSHTDYRGPTNIPKEIFEWYE